MATRFYPQPVTNPDVTPAFAGWDVTTGMNRRKLLTTRTDSSSAATNFAGTGVANQNRGMWQFTTNILPPQNYNCTFKGQFRTLETNTTDDYAAQLIMRAFSSDGATALSTLINFHSNALDASEFTTALTNRKFPLAALSPVSISYNALVYHRLVIDVGIRQYSTSVANAQINVRDNNASDLAEDETATNAFNSWFELSQNIIFGLSGGDMNLDLGLMI